MSGNEDRREQELAQALRQLSTDHQFGRLSMPAYRQLRRRVIEASESGEDIRPMMGGQIPETARPGPIVWIAAALIVGLLALLFWLFR
ncbi:MAG: hypothetical protein KJO54_06880 [Gammaproteobacteria bacterium]|nr:hypothetical protein [Gammaproteobacteria bacterium]NNF61455.1 hypothetical protein [Gammaproteobacteria bacterium]NNM21179.1 hypothetical protein [Gammaproteobacteria bacterium]